MKSILTQALLLMILSGGAAAHHHDEDTCLMIVARNLSNPGGNYFSYVTICERTFEISKGDRLVYDIFLHLNNPSKKGGLDLICDDGASLRDSGAVDGAQLRAHGDATLDAASGKWLRREISLAPLAGKKALRVDAQFEGDEKGEYIQFIDNIIIERSDGSRVILYDDGAPKNAHVDFRNGYSEHALCRDIPRTEVAPGAALEKLISEKKAKEELYYAKEALKAEFDQATRFAKAEKRDDLVQELKNGIGSVPSPDEFAGTSAEYHELLHKQRGQLDHAHPLMQQYGGHLVGHAHIDLQWLWEWPEGLDFTRSTFEQACKFMDEFPEFTFTQSSAGLYEKIEEQYPELFEVIVKRAKEGRFEFVGGRWCEGDTNMISSESHARHLLYGQRYYKKAFGKIATVGWEPDTFGHTAQMPQILKLGGIDSYYFCRGGVNKPLFWWESPDGSRVLAFDEPATGSWYNSDITENNVNELLEFYEKTGLKNLIWVYGVGNHGGGPTREMIQKAVEWKSSKGRPAVQFSTARKFFDLCKEKDLTKLPVVNTELNPVFRGCYTTHGDIKRLNHFAEVALTMAESMAAMASRSGFPYPATDLARAWKTVCWNHHHDTLPGSGIHDSYELSHIQLTAVIDQANWIAESAARHMAYRVEDKGEGEGIIVYNPLGWERDALVTATVENKEEGILKIVDGDGRELPSHLYSPGEIEPNAGDFSGEYRMDPARATVSFIAKGLPSFGYKTFRAIRVNEIKPAPHAIEEFDDESVVKLSNKFLDVVIERKTAQIISIRDKQHGGREVLTGGRAGNRIEAHMEAPHGMSAWETGKIVDILPAATTDSGGSIIHLDHSYIFQNELTFGGSRIIVNITLLEDSPRIDFDTEIQWREAGSAAAPAPMLRVAFPVAEPPAKNADGTPQKTLFTFTCGVPFGDTARPADGEDVAAIQWAAVTSEAGGAALLNDYKHGYSCSPDGELLLTLVRASYDPDPRPDQYTQTIRYSLLPVDAGVRTSQITRAAMEFNIPALGQRILHNYHNSFTGDRRGEILPAARSFIQFDGLPDVVPTCLKRAEDTTDLIVRFYQDSKDAASGSLFTSTMANQAQIVNFLETALGDPLLKITPRPGPASSSAPAYSQFRVDLRPYEIKTVKLVK